MTKPSADDILLDPEDTYLRAIPWRVFRSGHTHYVAARWLGDRIYLHRVVLGLCHGDALEADHVNGNGLDNRRANLRAVTHAQNIQNQRKRAGTSSRFRNVSLHRPTGKWVASLTVGGRYFHIGTFVHEEDAGREAAAWRAEHMPFSTDRSLA